MIILLVVAALLLPAAPALAINEYLCEGVPSAPFLDVDRGSPFAPHIDCLVDFAITSGTSPDRYSPAAPVERWQMAIFLQNVWIALFLPAPSADSQGFTDISGLTLNAQAAINEVAQLGITTGVAPGVYGPFGAVPRWQMAIFLARFIKAAGVGLPSPGAHGFTDIGALSAEAQTSIALVKSLGITTGTTATTYSPNQAVTREQMAAFLIRTLQVSWFISTTDYLVDCTVDDQGVDRCTGSGEYLAGVPLRFLHIWYTALPGDTTGFDNDGTKIDFFIDGALQAATERNVLLPGILFQYWDAAAAGGLSGNRVLETRYFFEGDLIATDTVTVNFS